MNIENHIHNAKAWLETAQAKIEAHDYDSALAMLADSYSNVRELIEHVWELKRAAASAEVPAGQSSGGP